jgi:hypothetical protein
MWPSPGSINPNSLKSGGRWMVAIDDLAHLLYCFQAFIWSFGKPILLFVRGIEKRRDHNNRPQ